MFFSGSIYGWLTQTVMILLCILPLCGCQHNINPKDLDYPPDFSEESVELSYFSAEEAEVRRREIAASEYPAYTIEEGDLFRIIVYGEAELTSNSNQNASTMVTPDGIIVLPLLGPIHIGGMTMVEATEAITEAYREYVLNPRVALIPLQIHGKMATVIGAVNSPGLYTVSANKRLSDVLAAAGGFATGYIDGKTENVANVEASYLIRNGEILPIDFGKAVYYGDPMHNVRVEPHDIIYVVRMDTARVIVFGEVYSPNQMQYSKGMTIVDVIGRAGGLKDTHWGTALILRRVNRHDPSAQLRIYKVDIDDLLSGRGRNFLIAPEDVVYIPKDSISEYNVFVNKLMPSFQLLNSIEGQADWVARSAKKGLGSNNSGSY